MHPESCSNKVMSVSDSPVGPKIMRLTVLVATPEETASEKERRKCAKQQLPLFE